MQNLSQVASAISRIHTQDNAAHAEIDTFYAPSELHGDVTSHTMKAEDAALEVAGWTRADYNNALRDRVSRRFLHNSDLYVSCNFCMDCHLYIDIEAPLCDACQQKRQEENARFAAMYPSVDDVDAYEAQ